MITDTKSGQTNYCPNCEDQARRIKEVERRERMLVDALEHCLREHGGFTIKGETERVARAALNATPAQTEAWEWNQHVEWMKNLKPQAFALIVDGAFSSSHRHREDAMHEGMEIGARFDLLPLVAIPELKEVRE